jgi:hypothetical protein
MKFHIKTIHHALVLIAFLFGVSFSYAQDNELADNPRAEHVGLYAYGGVGPAIAVRSYGSERAIGFDLNTAMEHRYASGFLIRVMFDFSSFTFERGVISQESNGKVYVISGSNNVVSLLGSGGYYFYAGRFSPYVFAGVGTSFVSKPSIEIDESNNYIDTSLLVKGYLSTVTGAGLDFILIPAKDGKNDKGKAPFILYIESFYTYIPKTTETSVHKFNLVSLNVGIKSKL